MSPLEVFAAVLLVAGAGFTLLASIGVVRMPDTATRLTATSKASPFGVGLILAGSAIVFGEVGFALQAAAVAAFLTMTAPVAAHAIARSSMKHVTDESQRDDEG